MGRVEGGFTSGKTRRFGELLGEGIDQGLAWLY
jgi:hypothetical protein